MFNQIQELRGNVRVFARVRPFLPNDHAGPDAQSIVDPLDEFRLCVQKEKDKEKAIEHKFAFDKVFAPSVGQEMVFEEVSEFVQSALDGYNVCLFSYGQTGSGKTHTMQGSGVGQMRGIIPRAIEQAGTYKTQLEGDGWTFVMQVSAATHSAMSELRRGPLFTHLSNPPPPRRASWRSTTSRSVTCSVKRRTSWGSTTSRSTRTAAASSPT